MDHQFEGRCVAVTGGCGFIGANLLLTLVPRHPAARFVNLDCLSYAADPARVAAIEAAPNYTFERLDIRDRESVAEAFGRHDITDVIHLAAESHVDRSLYDPAVFVETNVLGTLNLLDALVARERHGRFLHVSTDDVYGSLPLDSAERFRECSPYDPSSPYSASKAASDHLARAYHRTYGLDVVVTNCSNNYGPWQFPEKLIPLMISNALEGRELPVYGDGRNVRDWIHVSDHCEGLEAAFLRGEPGGTYNLGADAERSNLQVVQAICDLVDAMASPLPSGASRRSLIRFVADRPGHDLRYAIDASLARSELAWAPRRRFEEGLADTVSWYLENRDWVAACCGGGAFVDHYARHYRPGKGGSA